MDKFLTIFQQSNFLYIFVYFVHPAIFHLLNLFFYASVQYAPI
ncbi:hypothetical protein DORFOR_02778 [Dorea formicigenerans ATCC 27755]|uniref:Uncharacterized protein n=1 Tax=Dorea formicigenerans ATCC 27755 TaxID=411461 RepID=B0G916_9FIRM|nr:hypothetical protein DORFOR_02778 [Dorea formicigenerans ATCC 27755]